MIDRITRTRPLLEEERGMTLAELMVAMFVLGIVMLVFTMTLGSVQQAVVRQDNLSRTNDQARLAMQQLDREIRSGNVLYDPADTLTGYQPGYYLRVYTQANAPTRALEVSGSNGFSCVMWQILPDGRLLTRRWPPNTPESASPWYQVATGIVNRTLSVPAFALDPDPAKAGRTVSVTFRVNDDLARYPTHTVEITESLTGRNTSYGYPTSVCSPAVGPDDDDDDEDDG